MSTVQRRLREVCLKAYRARRKPRLTPGHRQKRLQFSIKHHHRTTFEVISSVLNCNSYYSGMMATHLPGADQERVIGTTAYSPC